MSVNYKELIKKKETYDNYILESFNYNSCAGMDGGFHKIEVLLNKKTIIYTDKEYDDRKEKVKKYKLNEEDISFFLDYINKYHLPDWKDVEPSEFIALDEPSKTLTFIFDKENGYNEFYSVDSNIDIDIETYKIYKEFIDKMNSYKK